MQLTIKDTTFGGKIINQIDLSFPSYTVTVKDIITQRVTSEVAAYNQSKNTPFKGLIQPTDAEQVLNGFKRKNNKEIDAEKQVYIALEAFTKNSYFVLIDDLQAESLTQQVVLNDNTEVNFIKLTPLVGG